MHTTVHVQVDELGDAIGGIRGSFVCTKPLETDWWSRTTPAGRVTAHLLQIGSGATFVGTGSIGEFTVCFPMVAMPVHVDGGLLRANSLVVVDEKQPFTLASASATMWA